MHAVRIKICGALAQRITDTNGPHCCNTRRVPCGRCHQCQTNLYKTAYRQAAWTRSIKTVDEQRDYEISAVFCTQHRTETSRVFCIECRKVTCQQCCAFTHWKDFHHLPVRTAPLGGELMTDVGSMVIYGDRLYVGSIFAVQANRRRDWIDIPIYEIERMNHVDAIRVYGLGSAVYGMAASELDSRLYVADHDNKTVILFDMSASSASLLGYWSIDAPPTGLSVTGRCTVIVAIYSQHRIVEFDQNYGTPIHEFVSTGDSRPWHAIQLPRPSDAVAAADDDDDEDELAASLHGDDQHFVGILRRRDGLLLRRIGGEPGSGASELNHPSGLAVDAETGCLFIPDSYNHRIVIVDQSLNDAHTLLESGDIPDAKIQLPMAVCVDRKRRRLLVGGGNIPHRLLVVCGLDVMIEKNFSVTCAVTGNQGE